MAAGLGFKTFNTGDVLSSGDTNGYLMQGIWVFANAAARTAAVTSPQEGNYSYLKDTNSTEYYTGSAWVSAGGGSGGMTLINTGGTTLTGATTSISSIPTTYKNLQLIIRNFKPATDGADLLMRLNGVTTNNILYHLSNRANNQTFGDPFVKLVEAVDNTTAEGLIQMDFYDYANTTAWKNGWGMCTNNNSTTATNFNYQMTGWSSNQTAAITELTFFCGSGNMTSGTAYLYGVS
jgi:hypothetical protein